MKKELFLGICTSIFLWSTCAFPKPSESGKSSVEKTAFESDSAEFKNAIRKEVKEILKARGWVDLRLYPNKAITLEIADKNPYSAIIFSGLYDNAHPPLPEKGPMFFTLGDIFLTPDSSRKIIEKYASGENVKVDEKRSENNIIAEYEIRRTIGKSGYLNIEVYKIDNEWREIEKILPNIRVQLKRIGGEGDDGHWEPTGWGTY